MNASVGNFVHDLVEMAKSHERLPELERENAELREACDRHGQTISDRELAIHRYKEDIETLHSRIRDLEVSRDDAELRFLEVEERAITVTNRLRDMQVILGHAVDTIDPPKPQPVEVNVPELTPMAVAEAAINEALGQSEATPTTAHEDQTSGSIIPVEPIVATEPSEPYRNKYYHDFPSWISRDDWHAGGGDDYSYDWRPSSSGTRF